MTGILLTPYQGKILGPIAKYVLGPIIEAIFNFFDFILGNFDKGLIGLSIIFFTLVIYLLLMPLTIKQQKFSKLSSKMNPELQAIQAKYKNKKDNDSMMAMNAETKAVYAKYGVSPSGSCVQLIIQMPILFALYRVIYSMPAYISRLRDTFGVIADQIIANGQVDEIKALSSAKTYINNFNIDGNIRNAVIDVLNVMNESDLKKYSVGLEDTFNKIKDYNTFLGLNIANSPSYIITNAWNAEGGPQILIIVGALLIPILAAATQWINTKLMPQQATNNSDDNQQNSMAQSMKMMNTVMPLMSAVFCFTFPSGMGLYWIAGAVVRSVQQIVINKSIDKIDVDDLIKKNQAKQEKKLIKAGIDPKTVNRNATINTRNVTSINKAASAKPVNTMSQEEKDAAMKKATEFYNNGNAKPGSIASKANMVKQFNEKNNN